MERPLSCFLTCQESQQRRSPPILNASAGGDENRRAVRDVLSAKRTSVRPLQQPERGYVTTTSSAKARLIRISVLRTLVPRSRRFVRVGETSFKAHSRSARRCWRCRVATEQARRRTDGRTDGRVVQTTPRESQFESSPGIYFLLLYSVSARTRARSRANRNSFVR